MEKKFVDNGNGTITDTSTGLMWQKFSDLRDGKYAWKWQEAIDYCEALNIAEYAGHKDWRLPTRRELVSLVDDERWDPAIDPVFQCFSSYYWSSTPYANYTDYAWYVNFCYGVDSDYGSKSSSYYVRAVRVERKFRMMKVAYIAGPYRAETLRGVIDNIRHAEKYAIEYWQKGYSVICPHKNTALFDGIAPDDVWLEGDKELIRRLIPGHDVVVMIPGWLSSAGAREERKLAIDLKIEVIYAYASSGA
uniref:Lcl C-terminal domain-containing protein n=1 Tax=viral metagenome TaxID=1070528 RepID=A0A6M3KG77_9ZZZZ